MFLRSLWDKAIEKLGRFAAFLPMIGTQIKFDLENGDVAGVTARAHELREAAAALVNVSNKLDEVVADGSVNAVEATETLDKLDRAFDELEDVVKGYDEDDKPPTIPPEDDNPTDVPPS